jgi:Ca-activated chloride channel family protein
MTQTMTAQPTTDPASSGGRLIAIDGRVLPLRGAALSGDARGGLARAVLEQRFANPYAEPLAVTYSLPLPADAAVSGFAFTVGDRRIVGEIDRRHAARQRFEEAVASGRTAALLEQERSSLFTQEIGNVPPGATVVCEVTIDQRLRWLDEGQWEWRFPTTVAPRYLGAPGRVADAARVTQDVADGPLSVRLALTFNVRDALPVGARLESPSHAVHADALPGRREVRFAADGGVPLDRDVVLRWAVATPRVGLSLDVGRAANGAFGLLTVVPPQPGTVRRVARDLCVLLDTSGSMGGEPLDQARRIVSALVSSLGDEDQLELIEFSNQPRRWRRRSAYATTATKQDALKWLAGLSASGGTEMRSGIYEALAPLRIESQRQVVLVTDGLIGFETEVVKTILEKLPPGARLHTLGVGSAVNRSLTGPAARAGRGEEVIVGLGEDPERAGQRLHARTNAPLVVDLELAGGAHAGHAPERLPDLFAGAPALIGVKLDPRGGELVVRGRSASGPFEQRIEVPATEPGSGSRAVVALYGREAVEDAEMHLGGGAERHAIDAQVETLGLEFQISTRLTSWIAVTQEATVDPTAPTRSERMPHQLPYGMSIDGLGLRAPAPAQQTVTGARMTMAGMVGALPAAPLAPPAAKAAGGFFRGLFKKEDTKQAPERKTAMAQPTRRAPSDDRDEEAPAAADKPAAPPKTEADALFSLRELAKQGEAARRRLRGRIVVRKGRTLVVEIAVDGAPLDWRPEGEVRVTYADGHERTATIDAAATTRATAATSGLRLRLALVLDADEADAPTRLALGDLVIEL